MSDQPAQTPVRTYYVDDYQPPADATQTTASVAATTPNASTDKPKERLEDQNIFELLGVTGGSETEKTAFLDELQQVIWEDFLENDVHLLILDSEHQKLKELLGSESTAQLSIETQEKVIAYLETVIPDLEEIMIDKAVRLKADLVKERVAGMKKLHAGNQAALAKISTAEEHMSAQRWATAATILNTL